MAANNGVTKGGSMAAKATVHLSGNLKADDGLNAKREALTFRQKHNELHSRDRSIGGRLRAMLQSGHVRDAKETGFRPGTNNSRLMAALRLHRDAVERRSHSHEERTGKAVKKLLEQRTRMRANKGRQGALFGT